MSGSILSLQVDLPRSKSLSNRWLVLQRLSSAVISLRDISPSTDTLTLYRLLHKAGSDFDAGDGGTTFRFMLAYLCLLPGQHELNGTARMAERPIRELVDALVSLGAVISYDQTSGRLPLIIHGGRITGGTVKVDASTSSQFVSALLLIAPFLENGLELTLTGSAVSKPYMDMTIKVLQQAGASVESNGNSIKVHASELKSQTIVIEPDWSSAAFFYQACCLNPRLIVEFPGLAVTGLQGDESAMRLFSELGVETEITSDGLKIGHAYSYNDHPLHFNLTDCPDLGPALMMACFGSKRLAAFTGIGHLRHKESDRVAVLSQIIRSAGGTVTVEGDTLSLDGFPETFRPIEVDSHDDHRIAMSAAIFAVTGCPVSIKGHGCVDKSFPDFWEVIAPLELPVTFS